MRALATSGLRSALRLGAEDGPVFRAIAAGASWTLLYRVTGAASAFGVAVLSARLLGAEDYGLLQYVIGWTNLLLVLGGLGLARVCMRVSGEAGARGKWSALRGLVAAAPALMAGATLVFGLMGMALWHALEPGAPLALVAIGVGVMLLRQVYLAFNGFLVGQGRIARAGLGEFLRDILLLAALGGLYATAGTGDLAPETVMWLRLAAGLAALIVVLLAWGRTRAALGAAYGQAARIAQPRAWLTAGAQLMLVAGAAVVNANADILMVGTILGDTEVGPYHAATRGAEFVAFPLSILLLPLVPVIARLHATDRAGLRRVHRTVTLGALGLSLAVALPLVLQAEAFLGLFGPGFEAAATALAILVGAQVCNTAFGPVQHLLVMTGHQGAAAVAILAGTFTNIAGNALLIPQFGLAGAAAGTGLGILAWNLLSLYFVRRRVWYGP